MRLAHFRRSAPCSMRARPGAPLGAGPETAACALTRPRDTVRTARGAHMRPREIPNEVPDVKLWPAALLLIGALLAASACATEAPDTLGKIRASGAITLGYRDSSVPFSFAD